jgi:hypothetical protein
MGMELGPDVKRRHRLGVFLRRVLGRIFVPTRDEVVEGRRKLSKNGLHNLYSSRNKSRMIKSRSMGFAGYVARMGRRYLHVGFL